MKKTEDHTQPNIAVLITGTYREIEFLLRLFPYMAGSVNYDIYLILRHISPDELSRMGSKERDFEISQLKPFLNKRTFLCELPSIDPETAASRYLIPVGPTDARRECAMLSMFWGVFTAISIMKASLRNYTHVMKTRTDYLPWKTPWLSGMLELYEESDHKVIVEGCATWPRRYPDRLDIPWQGSVSDIFCFAAFEQFLKFWDFAEILPKLWTGISETTLFRAVMLRFLGDDLQSPRRNESLLKKYFFWEPNDSKQPFNMLRSNVFSEEVKEMILELLKEQEVAIDMVNKLIRFSYDFLSGKAVEKELQLLVKKSFSEKQAKAYLDLCHAGIGSVSPV